MKEFGNYVIAEASPTDITCPIVSTSVWVFRLSVAILSVVYGTAGIPSPYSTVVYSLFGHAAAPWAQ